VTYVVHASYGGVEVTLPFSQRKAVLVVRVSRNSRNDTCLIATELPTPVAPFSFQKHTHISLFPVVVEILIVIPHRTRPYQWTRTIRIGLDSAQRGTFTHQSDSVISRPMRSESETLSFLARPNLNGYTGRSQATAMSKPDKSFPLLILLVLPSLHNPGVGSYEFRSSGCPHSLEWLYFL
jgi:hypothetical protein